MSNVIFGLCLTICLGVAGAFSPPEYQVTVFIVMGASCVATVLTSLISLAGARAELRAREDVVRAEQAAARARRETAWPPGE